MDFDAAEITALISTATLCADCLAQKIGVDVRRVREVLNQVAESVTITTRPGRCDSCLKQTVVHRLG